MKNIRRCYEILELEPEASQDEIKQAYKDLAVVWHPDRYSHNPRLQQKAQDKLKEINRAYEVLKEYNLSNTTNQNHSQTKDYSNKLKLDLSQLENLLAANKWKEADLETQIVILKVVNREREGWLRSEEINNFPCQDLLTIDRLWVKYSNGNFGFSVQQDIWNSLGCKTDPWMPTQTKSERIFGDRIGWYGKNSWLSRDSFNYNQAVVGSLPRDYIFILNGWWSYSNSWTGYLLWGFDEVLLRLNHCKD